MRTRRLAATATAAMVLALSACATTNGEVPGVEDTPEAWMTPSPSQSSAPPAATAGPVSTPHPSSPSPVAGGQCGYMLSGTAARPNDLPAEKGIERSGTTTVTLTINDTPVVLTIDRSIAPCASNAFVSLAEQGFYSNSSCHRISTAPGGFLVCGDPTGTGNGGPGYSFPVERGSATGGTVAAGTVAMVPDSQGRLGSQFALVFATSTLEPPYQVIGSVDHDGIKTLAEIGSKGAGPDGRSPKVDTVIGAVVMG